MNCEIILAGFGGQGVMSAGKLLAYSGMVEGKKVSWFPSYGPEMRGGTANCHVIVSDNEINSPLINCTDVLIAMNKPSLDKFEDKVKPGGLIIIDESLVESDFNRDDIEYIKIPATKLASEMKNLKFANVILLGSLISKVELFTRSSFEKSLNDVLPVKKHHLIPDEMEAFDTGYKLGAEQFIC